MGLFLRNSSGLRSSQAISDISSVFSCGFYAQKRSNTNLVHGDLNRLQPKVRRYVEEKAKLCQPDNIHICDGSDAENDYLLNLMQKQGLITPLEKYENWYAILILFLILMI